MSKSLGNEIGVTDPPEEIYGKTMSIPDDLTSEYFGLLLGRERPAHGPLHRQAGARPRARLAGSTPPEQAELAERHYVRVVSESRPPEELETARFDARGPVHLPALIADQFGISRSEARRLIDQGAVALDDEPIAAGDPRPGARPPPGSRPAGRQAPLPAPAGALSEAPQSALRALY